MNILDIILNLLEHTSWKIIASVVTLISLYIIKLLVSKFVDKKIDHFKRRYFFRQTLNYIFWFLLVLILIIIWVDWFRSVITLLSLVIGAIVIVSKEAVLNLLASAVIIWRGLFQVGDRIEIDSIIGDVIEAGPMYFTLSELGKWVHGDEATGRVVKIPNSFVLYKPTWNYSKGLNIIWNEVTFDISKASDWNIIKIKIGEILEEISYKFSDEQINELIQNGTDIMFLNKSPEIFIKPYTDKTSVTVRYLTKFHKRRESENKFWELLFKNLKDELN